MKLKESIIKRRSIRKYEMEELTEEQLTEIKVAIKNIKPLFSDVGKFSYKIISHKEFRKTTGGLFRIDAPHYIVFASDKTDEAKLNIGYVGELAVLKLAEMNIGTVWLGGASSKEEGYEISIAFGKPKEVWRFDQTEAKRKTMTEIATDFSPEQRAVLEYVRLAPSAMNFQPWLFSCEEGNIHIYQVKAGGLIAGMKSIKEMQKIDIGIAIAHFNVVDFTFKNKELLSSKDQKYIGTISF
ncbi:MAG: hypothetical protein FWD89_04495 [Firmicutes bacterium]|nr:hypothetical protein [Bacillota bacterium]